MLMNSVILNMRIRNGVRRRSSCELEMRIGMKTTNTNLSLAANLRKRFQPMPL